MTRKSILDKALSVVTGERERQYGNPENNFSTIAKLWTDFVYGQGLTLIDDDGEPYVLDAHDVAIMMCLLKVGRIASGRTTEDNYVDLCGYASCAGEIAAKAESGESRIKPYADNRQASTAKCKTREEWEWEGTRID